MGDNYTNVLTYLRETADKLGVAFEASFIRGYYDSHRKVIGMPAKWACSTEDWLYTLAHEIRHAIQHAEGALPVRFESDVITDEDIEYDLALEENACAFGRKMVQDAGFALKDWMVLPYPVEKTVAYRIRELNNRQKEKCA